MRNTTGNKNEISFYVEGSSEDPYMVIFIQRPESNLSAYCSCPAGENGIYCKHRFNILDGKLDAIVSDNIDDVEIIQEWYLGSDIEVARDKVKSIEKEAAKVKRELTKAKKEVSKAMYD
jgi:hypothetical protein